MALGNLSIKNNPMISAIYFALLQSGYNYYSFERDTEAVNKLHSFISSGNCKYPFFSETRQNSCEVYPYWPRAAMLETATFFIDLSQARFINFEEYKNIVYSAKNISDAERNQKFWNWILQFPSALQQVMQSDCFHRYLEWENRWIEAQNQICKNELKSISNILDGCKEKFGSPFESIQIVINPIKCVYSSDYHNIDGDLTICLGELREDSIIHEFTHHIVHPAIEKRKDDILRCFLERLDVDVSYFLDGDDEGKLNAFEEYMVRQLTAKIVSGDIPENINIFFDCKMRELVE